MSNSNIDKFDEITGRLFADLYANFPVPILIKSANYSAHAEQSEDIAMNAVHAASERDFFIFSVKWLKNSGFITYCSQSSGGFHGAVLTSKGLQSLKIIPASLEASAGKALAEAVNSGKSEIIKSIVNQVVGAGVTFALKQVGFP